MYLYFIEKQKGASNRANENANGNLRPVSVTFIFC